MQLLASGEVVMTTAYNGRISGINKTEGKNFKVVWPGSIYAIDSWVILKDSPNKDQAMDFIAFASLPENQVKLPEYIAYGLPNKEAAAAVPAERRRRICRLRRKTSRVPSRSMPISGSTTLRS